MSSRREEDFLRRHEKAGNDTNTGGDNFINRMMLQSTQRESRAEEWRREDILRDIKRQDDVERREDAALRKEENRRRELEEKEVNRILDWNTWRKEYLNNGITSQTCEFIRVCKVV